LAAFCLERRPPSSVRPIPDGLLSPSRFALLQFVLLAALAGTAAVAASADGQHLVILEPSQGRPVFVQPGQTFYLLVRTDSPAGKPSSFRLRHAKVPQIKFPLLPKERLVPAATGYASARMTVPLSAVPGLYDIVMIGQKANAISRRSVRVVRRFRQQFRIVHLSNMNIGDPTAPDFDPQLPEEINLLAPEFIIATGDYTEWARIRNRPQDWKRVLDYMAKFDAPVFMLCGDHDDEASFTQMVANNLIGTIDYGNYHGLLLLDHGLHPVETDADQLAWIVKDLRENASKTLNFIVCHSDELGLIRGLRRAGQIDVLKECNVRMIICGGHADWDFQEFADLLKSLPYLHYIRTAQSSTAVRDKSTGVSHYRVIEVSGDRINYIYPSDDTTERLQHSVPAGRLRKYFWTPNDGTTSRVLVTVVNGLNRPWRNCRIWLRVRKISPRRPAVEPGRLLQCLDAGTYWACLVDFDLPDKSSVTLCADARGQVPPPRPVAIEIRTPQRLGFRQLTSPFGLTYYVCEAPIALRLTNNSDGPVTTWPIVRLNGSILPIEPLRHLPLTIPPHTTTTFMVKATLGRFSPGPHLLQVYLLEDPLKRLTTVSVYLQLQSPATQAAEKSRYGS